MLNDLETEYNLVKLLQNARAPMFESAATSERVVTFGWLADTDDEARDLVLAIERAVGQRPTVVLPMLDEAITVCLQLPHSGNAAS